MTLTGPITNDHSDFHSGSSFCVRLYIDKLVFMNRIQAKQAITLQSYDTYTTTLKHPPNTIINTDRLLCPFHSPSPWNLYNPPKWSKRVSKDLETGSSSRNRWMTMSKTGRKRKHTLPKYIGRYCGWSCMGGFTCSARPSKYSFSGYFYMWERRDKL